MLHGLDLFSGIGGLALALEPWVRPVAYCEIDRFCQRLLIERMRQGRLPAAPIWDDVRTLAAGDLPAIDVVYGGFPCQDISIAGAGRGLDGERSGLVFEALRLVAELRPSFVFLENTPAIRSRGAAVVVGRLAGLGYDARWDVLAAQDVGAPHRRERWWLLAYAVRERLPIARTRANTASRDRGSARSHAERRIQTSIWDTLDPELCRVFDGVSPKMDRIRALGNAVVPAQAREAFVRLIGTTNL